MGPSTLGGNDSTLDMFKIATSGPTGTPEVPGLVNSYVAGGLEMGMHSVMP